TEIASGDCGTHYSAARARIWNVKTGRLVFTTPAQAGAITAVDFSPGGRYFATPNRAGFAQVWDARTKRLVATFKGHTGEVNALVYAPEGRTIATSSTDGTARIWEPLTGRQLLVLRGHDGRVVSLAFTGDGHTLATASTDGTVRIWDVAPTGSRDWLTLEAHSGGVESVFYDPSGIRLLTTGIVDGKAKLWDARTGALLASYANVSGAGAGLIAGFGGEPFLQKTSPDGTLAIGTSSDGTAKLRDATGDVVASLGHDVQSAAFDPTGK